MRINFTIAYIQYSLSNLCSAKLSLVIAQEGFVSVAARRQFILIKSPDEWATTKQACRDELVVYVFFLPYIFRSTSMY